MGHSEPAAWFRWQDNCLYLHVYLQPRASSDQIIGLHGNSLKIRLTAPPLEGRANKHLIKFLARYFKLPQQHITIVQGELSRHKWVKIEGDKSQLAAFIENL